LMMNYVGAYDLEQRRFSLQNLRHYTVFQRLSEESLRQLNKGTNFVSIPAQRSK